MGTLEMISLMGRSGQSYTFTAIPIGFPLAAVGAVYAVLHDGPIERWRMRRSVLEIGPPLRLRHSRWTVLYIGQTDNLSARFANALRDLELARICATHLAVLDAEDESRRRSMEFDLVPHYASLLKQSGLPARTSLVESITLAPRSG
jgi:hypothetical protein